VEYLGHLEHAPEDAGRVWQGLSTTVMDQMVQLEIGCRMTWKGSETKKNPRIQGNLDPFMKLDDPSHRNSLGRLLSRLR
jgi:hypothetical protein